MLCSAVYNGCINDIIKQRIAVRRSLQKNRIDFREVLNANMFYYD